MESMCCSQALAAAINDEPGFLATTYISVSDLRRAGCPDVVVVDQSSTDTERAELRNDCEDLLLIVVGDERPRMGPGTFLRWKASVDDLLAAIRDALPGAGYADVAAQVGRLSPRETEILLLLVDGYSRSDIASRLYLSANTVRTHLGRIYTKLGTSSQAEAVALAWAAGLRPRIRQMAGCS